MKSKKNDINIVVGANEILSFRKKNKLFSETTAMEHVLDFLKNKKFKKSRVEILIGASRALDIIERNKNIKDKEIILKIMQDLPNIKISE